MQAKEILETIENSDIKTSDVLKLIFEGGYVNQEDFPEVFDAKGNVIMAFQDKSVYNTFCPFHGGQENGDSFAVYNSDKKCYCYNGACDFSKRPINLVEVVMATVYKIDSSVIYDIELQKPHFWKSVRFLVEHFGDELGIAWDDVKPQKPKRDITSDILKDTMNYYHFLGAENEFYNTKLTNFLVETRFLDKGVVPVQDLINDYKLGITPNSNQNMDNLFRYLRKIGYKKDDIINAKVCVEKENGVHDFFINRAIVPYIHKGKVIGFYGRDLNPNGKRKFRHMRLEGEVRIPNGLDNILGNEEFFLVEGEFSKIAVASLGYSNTMEARGVNGFKEEHADMIKRVRQNNHKLCQRCYLLFDPDDAGAESVEKIGKRLLDAGVEALVVRLPVLGDANNQEQKFVDPNDLLEVYGTNAKDKFENLKEEAISYDAFMLLHSISKDQPKNLSQARMVFKRYSEYLNAIPKLERMFIIEEIIEQMSSAIDASVLREYLKEIWLHQEPQKPVEGYSEALSSESPFLILTKSENFYKTNKKEVPHLVLVRDNEIFNQKQNERKLLLDGTFTNEEKQYFKKIHKVTIGRGRVNVHEGGKIKLYML